MSYNAPEKRNDAIDFLIDGMQDVVEKQNLETGEMEKTLEFNPKIPWYQGHNINRPFGEYARKIEKWENNAKLCKTKMSPEPAEELARDIILKLNEYKRGIDGKSSETWRDKNNNQSSTFQILADKTDRKLYNVKGDGKKTFLDGLLGRQASQEREESN